jgi:hypothetical protein
MVPRVERRVLAFDEESGIRIAVDLTALEREVPQTPHTSLQEDHRESQSGLQK